MHLSKKICRQPYQDGYRYSDYKYYFAPCEHNFVHLTLKRNVLVGTLKKERDEMVFCVTEMRKYVTESGASAWYKSRLKPGSRQGWALVYGNRRSACLLLAFLLSFSQYVFAQRLYPYYINKKNLWGYADSTGRVIIKPAFSYVYQFYRGLAVAQKGKMYGVIDQKGKWLIEPTYDYGRINYDIGTVVLFQGKKLAVKKYIVNGKLQDEEPEGYVYNPDRLEVVKPYTAYDRWSFTLTRSPDKKHGVMSFDGKDKKSEIVQPTYDSIWKGVTIKPFFYGSKNGKVAIIQFDTATLKFNEGPAQYDDVKRWSNEYFVVRIGKDWFQLKPSLEPQFIISDVDDIQDGNGSPQYYTYTKKGKVGLVINMTHRNAATEKDDWVRIDAKYKSIDHQPFFDDYWYQPKYYMFRVFKKNGKHGPMTTRGIELFR
ncbi:MAG TPA: WG repeat-containing protein [Cyclobacteriaceae bacterium]|nr:WG repeat-containing protein [Cyclobacteriaceae bacterium]